MDVNSFVVWLRRENILNEAVMYSAFFEGIYKNNLTVKGENILIISDWGYPGRRVPIICASSYFFAAINLGYNVDLAIQDPITKGGDASSDVIKKLLEIPDNSIIIICLSGKMGSLGPIGKSFRKYIKQKGHKFVSLSGLASVKTGFFPSIVHAMRVDPRKMHSKGMEIKRQFDLAKEVKVTTDLGTELSIDKRGVSSMLNSGLYLEYGDGGNLPAGEVYFYTNDVQGKVVIDGSIRTHDKTYVVDEPVEIYIRNGMISEIRGGKEADILRDELSWARSMSRYPEAVMRIAEFGIGLNANAKIIGPTVINEKSLGTAHIANGSNSWFGGPIKSLFHMDHVFRNPKIYLDGKELKI